MLAIVLSVCLQSDQSSCREERIDFSGPQMACMVQAPPILAEWGHDHPEWLIKSWKCSVTG